MARKFQILRAISMSRYTDVIRILRRISVSESETAQWCEDHRVLQREVVLRIVIHSFEAIG